MLKRYLFVFIIIYININAQDIGSDYIYNPFSVFFSGGYGIFQLSTKENKPFDIDYRKEFRDLFFNLRHPIKQIKRFGFKKFFTSEILPDRISINKAQFVPNYTLHFVGGIVCINKLKKWYKGNNFRYYSFFAYMTFYSYHLINEVVEDNSRDNINVDAISDIYIFDLLAVLLSDNSKMQRLLTTLNANEWTTVPFYNPFNRKLENTSQNFVFKYSVSKKFKLFLYTGMNSVGGVSIPNNNDLDFSFGAGFSSKKIKSVNGHRNKGLFTAEIVPDFGFFIDRNNSLLLSMILSYNGNYRFKMNIFPTDFFSFGNIKPYLYFAFTAKKEYLFGLTFNKIPLGMFF